MFVLKWMESMRDQTKAVIQFYEWINNALEITVLYFDFGLWKKAKKTLHFIIAIFFRRIISTERFFFIFSLWWFHDFSFVRHEIAVQQQMIQLRFWTAKEL